MIAYKGFNEDMTCQGFQYEEGKEFEYDGDIKLCEEGFHACKHPLECFDFYSPCRSDYHVIELSGEILEDIDSAKMVASKIKSGKAKGVVGSHIVLADWRYKDNDWELTGAKLFRVDGEMVKADTWYTLKGGELTEVE